MEPLTPKISQPRQRMIDDMRLRKMAGKTEIQYVRAVRRARRLPEALTRHRNC